VESLGSNASKADSLMHYFKYQNMLIPRGVTSGGKTLPNRNIVGEMGPGRKARLSKTSPKNFLLLWISVNVTQFCNKQFCFLLLNDPTHSTD
jgi:hypothetical protein